MWTTIPSACYFGGLTAPTKEALVVFAPLVVAPVKSEDGPEGMQIII